VKKDTPELISSSQLFNSSIHSFITEEEEEDEEDDGVSLVMSPHTSLPQLLQEYFVIIIAVDNLQKLGTKKVTT
jgi:hypothetical protein